MKDWAMENDPDFEARMYELGFPGSPEWQARTAADGSGLAPDLPYFPEDAADLEAESFESFDRLVRLILAAPRDNDLIMDGAGDYLSVACDRGDENTMPMILSAAAVVAYPKGPGRGYGFTVTPDVAEIVDRVRRQRGW